MPIQWHEQISGIFVASLANLRMRVHRPHDDRGSRFTVQKESASGARVLIGSGSSPSVGQAMHAAEAMAGRVRSLENEGELAVMVVDDEDSVREAVAEALRDEGYDVSEARNGEEALHQLKRSSRRMLLVSDVNLGPDMSGLELAATVRGLWPGMSVLLMSGEKPSMEPGCKRDFLMKPFSLQALIDKVSTVIDGTETWRAVAPT